LKKIDRWVCSPHDCSVSPVASEAELPARQSAE
jgi:hypothetical protein